MAKAKDLTGKRFGCLIVLYRAENRNGRVVWHCKCDCGNEKDVSAGDLSKGSTKSCGCMSHKINDISGQRFGRLVALEYVGKNKWLCKCDCGNTKVVFGGSLHSGSTKSCGCLRRDRGHTTHGGRYERLHGVWANMLNRCENEKSYSYGTYGALGIHVCEEWHDYAKFRAWALSSGYDSESPRGSCTLERIDVNGDYCPENCSWITIQEQQKNKRAIHKSRRPKPVELVDADGHVLASYPSMLSASKDTGESYPHIKMAVRGFAKQDGYTRWRLADVQDVSD